jgi:hypothetical protein
MHDRAYDSFSPLPIGQWARWAYVEGDRRGLHCKRWMPFPANRSGQGAIPAGPTAVRAARTEFVSAAPPVHGTAGRPTS